MPRCLPTAAMAPAMICSPMPSVSRLSIALVVVATAVRAEPPATNPNKAVPVQLTWDQKIPARDGVKLSATIYRNPAQTKPVPVIFTMTPYIAQQAATQGMYFAQNGYAFVAVDDRGRGNSDGVFLPGQVEGRDGYDVVEWIAKQPWCDGQVAMWGGSWLGFTQWSVAKELPPHLVAIAPTAAVLPGVDYPQPNGIFVPYALRWLNSVAGKAANDGLFAASDLWTNAEWQLVTSGRPFADLEAITGATGTLFKTWLAHPREDAFWQAATPRAEQFAKLHLPILTITGHYDGDQLGALTYYDRHLAVASKDEAARHWLVIGPWDHAGTRRPRAELGGVTFGPAAAMSMEALHKAWYDHVLKHGPRPEFLKDRVAVFVMGKNTWIYASELKRIEGAPLALDLDLTGAAAGDVTRSGRLLPAAAAAASMVLVSDPKYLPAREELDSDDEQMLKNQRDTYRDLRGQVVLHTAPFAAETVLAGRPRLHVQVAVDQPDADLGFELDEVLPDGSSIALSNSMVRLRYRKGGVTGTPMVRGKAELIDVPGMNFFARAIAKGSRLRLVIDATPHFGWQRNTNTGNDLATEPGSAGRVAKLTITTGPKSGSRLELPRPDKAVLDAP